MKIDKFISRALIFLLILFFGSLTILGQLSFNMTVGFPFPILTNISSEVFESLMVFADMDLCYLRNNNLIVGIYTEFLMTTQFFLDTYETLFWILFFPISIFLAREGIWPFPTFHDTFINLNIGPVIGIRILNEQKTIIDLLVKIGIGNLSYSKVSYQGLAFNLIPNLLIKFPFGKFGGFTMVIGYNVIILKNPLDNEKILYYPFLGINLYLGEN